MAFLTLYNTERTCSYRPFWPSPTVATELIGAQRLNDYGFVQ